MTDNNGNISSHPNDSKRPPGRSSIPRSSSSYGIYGSHDGIEPTTVAVTSFPYETSMGSTEFGRLSPRNLPESSSDTRSAEHQDHISSHDAHHRRRSYKHRPSGGFLLSNGILGEDSKPDPRHRADGRRKSRIPVDSRKGKSPLRSSADSTSSGSVDSHGAQNGLEMAGARPPRMSASAADFRDDRPLSQQADRRRSMLPALRPGSAPLDADSAQIVSMAMDLSKSRQQAPRRNISTPIPPRLAQLPDATPGLSLKQHLQQQRRTSRNISPRAERNPAPRVVSATRISNTLQPSLDHEVNHQYHLSSSTLNRAQRAKEYIELAAHYRRLLSFLPPLKEQAHSRPSTSDQLASSSSTSTPSENSTTSQYRSLGRAYNPLQYIRNRKIRTRERKTIDGDAEGFGDAPRVADWIDRIASSAITRTDSELPELPPFPAADEYKAQQLPVSNLPRPIQALNKPKRPRFDWSIDPADMLADIYWLEHDDNRYLIEDRHYRKIFPPKPETAQSAIHATEHIKSTLVSPAIKEIPEGSDQDMIKHEVSHAVKPDTEPTSTTLTSTGDRARRRFRDFRGTHKHNSSTHSHHEFLRFRRGSSSDSSDNESDRRRRGRGGTISARGEDLLEKQMIELIVKESQDEQNQSASGVDASPSKSSTTGTVTPDQISQVSRREHSRKNSYVEAADHPEKFQLDHIHQTPHINPGRASLEVPNRPDRYSLDIESPQAAISDIGFRGRQNGYIPTIGMNLSPNVSRPSSPTRNPFSKVRSMFRDRSRDREDHENDDKIMSPIDQTGTITIPTVIEDTVPPLERPGSKSSTREFIPRLIHESHKTQRSMGSLSLRPEEQVGLRTIFKGGAKLDDMIRGGVSKMTDLIWKKDSDSDSDDSYFVKGRGQHPGSTPLSPTSPTRPPGKNYMDVLPSFKSTVESTAKSMSHNLESASIPTLPRPSRSPRFDQLKPPRIDIRKPSPEVSDIDEETSQSFMDSNTSGLGLQYDKTQQTSKDLHITIPHMQHMEGEVRGLEPRTWSIPDRASLSQHALVSRREVARLRTLILCSGIKAMEISRRAHEPRPLYRIDSKAGSPWTEVRRLMPEGDHALRVSQTELFPKAAHVLSQSVDRSLKSLENEASEFAMETVPRLQQQIDAIHNRVATDFMDMTSHAADEAEDVSRDILDSQRLKVKNVVDSMDKMLRRRRRRFRWVRRAGWLAVEWLLVGFMWYVWFVVMITRIIFGVGRGALAVVRWLLWL